jgi:hypothetical protein
MNSHRASPTARPALQHYECRHPRSKARTRPRGLGRFVPALPRAFVIGVIVVVIAVAVSVCATVSLRHSTFGEKQHTLSLELRRAGVAVAKLASTGSASDVSIRYDVSVSKLPVTGTGTYVGAALRSSGSQSYRSGLHISPGGKVSLFMTTFGTALTPLTREVPLPVTLKADQHLSVRTEIAGDHPVRLITQAWVTSTEPASPWQQTGTDASATESNAKSGARLWGLTALDSAYVVRIDATNIAITKLAPEALTSTSGDGVQALAGRPSTTAGSVPVGTAEYPVPPGAIVVAPDGSDAASGSLAAPLRTVAHAVAIATSGSTIVLRAGTYHEQIEIYATKRLTIQAYPNEAVWFDGSSPITTWQPDGSTWRTTGWTAEFDSSPTYARGQPDGTTSGYRFLNPAYPMAAHPDQVWIDGNAQTQVATLAEVKPGTFYVDYSSQSLYLGSDPTKHQVRASDLRRAFNIESAGSILRGFGIRAFAPSVPDIGAVTLEAPGITAENLTITDSATTGISADAAHVTLRQVTVTNSGMLGIHANYADDLTLDRVLDSGNNTEHFNTAPVAGGFKITRSRGLVVERSAFNNNLGTGLWTDQSVYDMKFVSNDIVGNQTHGLFLEISSKAIITDNLIMNNAADGLEVNDTNHVQIWNNSLIDNGRDLSVYQDQRSLIDAQQLAARSHPQAPIPDMTYQVADITAYDNVIVDAPRASLCLVCVLDYTGKRSFSQLDVTLDANFYARTAAGTPISIGLFSGSSQKTIAYSNIGELTSGSGQERGGLELDGIAVTNSDGSLLLFLTQQTSLLAKPPPTDIAELVLPRQALHLGAHI